MAIQLELNFEIWKPIPNFLDYAASNLGRIKRRLPGHRTYPGKIISPYKCHNGYYRASLYKNGKEFRRRIHSIIMETFVGVKPNGLQVNHKNRMKTDNRVDNLEYVIFQENMSHAYEMGLIPCIGEDHPGSKLTEDNVKTIRSLSQILNQKKLAELFGLSSGHVSAIINHKAWKHI